MPFPIPEALYGPIVKFICEKLPALISPIPRHRPLVALTACFLLGGSIFEFYQYIRASARLEQVMGETVKADLESTPQRYKGLEAFILSRLDPVRVRQEVAQSTFTDDFPSRYAKMWKAAELLSKGSVVQKPQSNCSATDIGSLSIVGTPSGDSIVNDKGCPGFLFMPLALIPGGSDLMAVNNSSEVTELIQKSPYIKRDLLLTRALSEPMGAFLPTILKTNIAKTDGFPAQVYVITRSGLNRILNQNISNPASYYGTQFSANTYFPDRPYFIGAMTKESLRSLEQAASEDSQKRDSTVGHYFYVSSPYLDLGGNGIIVTLSRPLGIKTLPDVVFCLDLPLQDEKLDSLVGKIADEFRGDKVKVTMTVNANGNPAISDSEPKKEKWNDDQSEMVRKAKALVGTEKDISDFFGNIQELNGKLLTEKSGQALEVSIPLGDLAFQNGTRTAKFMYVKIDFAKRQKNIALTGLIACSLFGVFTVFLALVWGFAVKDSQEARDLIMELREAFDRVGKVMAAAPVPYALLDSNDYVINCNVAFEQLLKLDMNVIEGQQFRQLVVDSDRVAYDSVQKKRRAAEAVSPYHLRMNTLGNHPKAAIDYHLKSGQRKN